MEILNVHRASVHLESDHDRIIRLTKMISSTVVPEGADVQKKVSIVLYVESYSKIMMT